MSVQVLGVMVPKIVVNDHHGNPLSAEGRPVRLTLTEKPRSGVRPELRKCHLMKVVTWPDFDAAAQNAFSWWNDKREDVVWKLEACDEKDLPALKGPSLGGAFAVGLTLLHYRGAPQALSKLDTGTQASCLYSDFSNVSVSAAVLSRQLSPEAIALGAVGGMPWKVRGLAACGLVVSCGQGHIDTGNGVTVLRVETVKEAINTVFSCQARNIPFAL